MQKVILLAIVFPEYFVECFRDAACTRVTIPTQLLPFLETLLVLESHYSYTIAAIFRNAACTRESLFRHNCCHFSRHCLYARVTIPTQLLPFLEKENFCTFFVLRARNSTCQDFNFYVPWS
jgi:hypothetical protein